MFKSLKGFLKFCREKIETIIKDNKDINNASLDIHLHGIIGNSACDLDSVVSAVVYAYYLATKQQNHQKSVDENKIFYFPIFNIDRSEYKLKTEVCYWLNRSDINQSDLIFKDHPCLVQDRDWLQKVLVLTLVDHNVSDWANVNPSIPIVQIIDHHKKSPGPNTTIEQVGSCSTLVADIIFRDQDACCYMDNCVMEWLYATIMLDTICLDPMAGRATIKDVEICERIQSHMPGLISRKYTLYTDLVKAKMDISGLTNEELFMKDIKYVRNSDHTIPIASFPILVQNVITNRWPNIIDAFDEFCRKHNFKCFVMLGIHFPCTTPTSKPIESSTQNSLKESFNVQNNEKTRRDIAVYAAGDTDLLTNLCNFLLSYNTDDGNVLELEELSLQDFSLPHNVSNFDHIALRLFEQHNIKATRKQILPIIEEYMDEDMITDINIATFDDFAERTDNESPFISDFMGENASPHIFTFDMDSITPELDIERLNQASIHLANESIQHALTNIDQFKCTNSCSPPQFTTVNPYTDMAIVDKNHDLTVTDSLETLDVNEKVDDFNTNPFLSVAPSDSFFLIKDEINETLNESASIKLWGEGNEQIDKPYDFINSQNDQDMIKQPGTPSFDIISGHDIYYKKDIGLVHNKGRNYRDVTKQMKPLNKNSGMMETSNKSYKKSISQSFETNDYHPVKFHVGRTISASLDLEDTVEPSFNQFVGRKDSNPFRTNYSCEESRNNNDDNLVGNSIGVWAENKIWSVMRDVKSNDAWPNNNSLVSKKASLDVDVLNDMHNAGIHESRNSTSTSENSTTLDSDIDIRVSQSDSRESNSMTESESAKSTSPEEFENVTMTLDKSLPYVIINKVEKRTFNGQDKGNYENEDVVSDLLLVKNELEQSEIPPINFSIDMSLIERYKRIITHGGMGYLPNEDYLIPILLLSGNLLPAKSLANYEGIMENLFFYIIKTLNILVHDEYVLVFFEGPTESLPPYRWLLRYHTLFFEDESNNLNQRRQTVFDKFTAFRFGNACVELNAIKSNIDFHKKFSINTLQNIQSLGKKLRAFYIVNPSIWIRLMCTLSRPFIRKDIWDKTFFIPNKQELLEQININPNLLPL